MDTIVEHLIGVLLHGGSEVIAFLVLFIIILLFDRRRLTAEIARKDVRVDKIIDDYHKGSFTLAEALNALKMVLYELRSKIN